MIKGMLSVIIPDRNGQPYLQKTIDDILSKAQGEIEIIVVEDGVFPDPNLKTDKRVIELYHGAVHNSVGMRDSINKGVAISHGEYIMKTDEHTMFDIGFDRKLKENCENNWVVIPRRYRLNADDWKLEEYLIDGPHIDPRNGDISFLPVPDPQIRHVRPPVDYMSLDYPYQRPFDKTCGLHGAEDKQRGIERKDIMIDDVMTMQGSCYFMKRSHWDWLGGLDATFYGQFTQEAQEISNKTWLGGGRVIVNKNTWYAHMHKGKRGKGYGFSNAQYEEHKRGTEKGRVFCIDYWVNNKHLDDPKMIHPFSWLLKKFWPVPTWPENWREQIEIDKLTDYSRLREQNNEI